ncbi:MAG TPA: hypothetical protein VE596_05910 [Gaiellaceae bacterium]|jgi:hypothetical protein|nr:hypothetical protein [Gaiellaceae bacterium]
MIADVARLLAANLLFLAAGLGVRRLIGSTHGTRTASGVALTYLVGLASFGVLAQLLLVAGFALNTADVIGLTLLLLGAGLVRRPRIISPSPAPHIRGGRERLLALLAAAVLVVVGIQSLYEPLAAWDAWAFWIPKAKSLVLLNGLDPRFFAAPTTANGDYPLLLPAVEAADFRFMGRFDVQVLHLQFWLVLVAFLGALPALLRDQVRPVLLRSLLVVLACAPSLALHAQSAYADVPLAVFMAIAGVLGWRWLVLREATALRLFAVFAAAALATKVEGRLFVAALVLSLAGIAARESARRSCEALAAGLVAALAGIVPWWAWTHAHGIHGTYHADLAGLGSNVHRVGPAGASLLGHAFDPFAWLVLLPSGLAALLLASWWRTDHRTVALVVSTFLSSLGLLVASYWATPYGFEWHLHTSADRVVIAPVLLVAVLTPVLLESVLRSAD